METADAEEEEYQKRRKTTTAEKEEEKEEEEEGEKFAVNNNVSTSTRSLPATFCYTSPTYIPYSDPFGIAYPPPPTTAEETTDISDGGETRWRRKWWR